MRIPYRSVIELPPAAGTILRVNLILRAQGPPQDHRAIRLEAGQEATDVAESFGILRLCKPNVPGKSKTFGW
jgi:hypothetical protein